MRPGIPLLRSIPVFAQLRPGALAELDSASEVVAADRGEQLFRQGSLPLVLFFLLDGLIALSSSVSDGSTAVVDVIRPMSDLVLASVIGALPYLQSAHAVTRSRLLAIQAGPLRALTEREPELAAPLLHAMSREVRGLVRQVRDLKLRTTTQRLGAYLLTLVDDPDALTAELRLPFEKGLLAARLGCRQENLSRAFASLRELGVETRGARVTLSDIPRLTAYSVPDYLNDPELTKEGRAAVTQRVREGAG